MPEAVKPKEGRLHIPPRDKDAVSSPSPVLDGGGRYAEQVKNAFDFGLSRYAKAMEELSKV